MSRTTYSASSPRVLSEGVFVLKIENGVAGERGVGRGWCAGRLVGWLGGRGEGTKEVA